MVNWIELVGCPAVGKTTMYKSLIREGGIPNLFSYTEALTRFAKHSTCNIDLTGFQSVCLPIYDGMITKVKTRKANFYKAISKINKLHRLDSGKNFILVDEGIAQIGAAIGGVFGCKSEELDLYMSNMPVPTITICVDGSEETIKKRFIKRAGKDLVYRERERKHSIASVKTISRILKSKGAGVVDVDIDRDSEEDIHARVKNELRSVLADN